MYIYPRGRTFLDQSHFDALALELLFIKVFNRPSQIGLGISYAHVGEQETETEGARTKHITNAKTSGTGPVLEQDVIETRYHVCKLFL